MFDCKDIAQKFSKGYFEEVFKMDNHGTVSMKNENRYKSLKCVFDDIELLELVYILIIYYNLQHDFSPNSSHSFNFRNTYLLLIFIITDFYRSQNENEMMNPIQNHANVNFYRF